MADDLLRLRSLRVRTVDESQDGYYLISADSVSGSPSCPHCSSSRAHRHGTLPQRFADVPIHGRQVLIELDRKRYLCPSCNKTFIEQIVDLDTKRLATARLVRHVRDQCLKKTFAQLSREVGLDDQTVKNIFSDYVAELQATVQFVTPECLGIDEIKVVGQNRAVITNVEKNTLFDLLENRNKKTLVEYFTRLPNRQAVRLLAMDMWSVYRQVADICFPGVPVVVDRFHVERMANDALERVRKAVRRGLNTRQRLKLKDDRHVLLARFDRLNLAQQSLCQSWFQEFPIIAHAHRAKEEFAAIYQAPSRSAAERLFDRWDAGLHADVQPYFRDLLHAVRSRRVDVFNYFDHPITNAYTESINNLIKLENRMGRGYSFEVLRARMLYDQTARKDGSTSVRRRAKRASADDGALYDFMTTTRGTGLVVRPGDVDQVLEYGPYIPTLVRLLEDGHFE
jgi:transposase